MWTYHRHRHVHATGTHGSVAGVLSTGRCGGLLQKRQVLLCSLQILSTLVKGTRRPVTCKIRILPSVRMGCYI